MNEKKQNDLPIPHEFYSYSEGAPFDKCIQCQKYLLDEGSEYFIEKAYKRYTGYSAKDVIFEYAICIGCTKKMHNQMSKESRNSIEQYFVQNIDVNQRMSITTAFPDDPAAWIKHCIVNNTSIEETDEYQICAHCNGKYLKLNAMPYMVSGAIIDRITNLLSHQTLDKLDGFIYNNFGPPPELVEPIPKRRVLLI